MSGEEGVRIDKWLWAARFFKTRTLATDAIEGGHVQLNGLRIKPSRNVKAGDRIELVAGDQQWVLIVQALADKRGPASVARTLYEETAESIAARQARIEQRRLQHEPADDLRGRPTKRDRRAMTRVRWD
ncbi:RNA-binding S4 domain-containing protein [Uliginosibacterium sediminicola]|uniref:RNA-binding S4 domain-containing protein n=1 Tax=Uliginosibacterium sediminicola TaxID=2024550 RepID=A0ABU9YTG5_9RHOO